MAAVRDGVIAAHVWYVEESSYPYLTDRIPEGWPAAEALLPRDVPEGFRELSMDDSERIAQDAVRVIPPGHPLAKQELNAIARCARCRVVLLAGLEKFGLTWLTQSWEREVLPNLVTEISETYEAAYRSMQCHVASCAADRC